MYICLCKAVTDNDIEAAVFNGAHSLAEVQKELEVSTGCGRCISAAKLVVDQCLNKLENNQSNYEGLRVANLNPIDVAALVYAA